MKNKLYSLLLAYVLLRKKNVFKNLYNKYINKATGCVTHNSCNVDQLCIDNIGSSALLVDSPLEAVVGTCQPLPTPPPVEIARRPKFLTVIYENEDPNDVLAQPFFKEFSQKGIYLKNYFGIVHPSQPNYVALTSGTTSGDGTVSSEAPGYSVAWSKEIDRDNPVILKQTNIIDLIEKANLTWRVYAENIPQMPFPPFNGNCSVDTSADNLYKKKHNPFCSYLNINTNPQRLKNIVEAGQFARDVANNDVPLPDYMFYVPNMNNDGHDTDVGFANTQFSKLFNGVISQALQKDPRLVVIATFDEGNHEAGDAARVHLPTYCALMGNGIQPNTVINAEHNHFSLLYTIESYLGIGNLGRYDNPHVWFNRHAYNDIGPQGAFSYIPGITDQPPQNYYTVTITNQSNQNLIFGVKTTADWFAAAPPVANANGGQVSIHCVGNILNVIAVTPTYTIFGPVTNFRSVTPYASMDYSTVQKCYSSLIYYQSNIIFVIFTANNTFVLDNHVSPCQGNRDIQQIYCPRDWSSPMQYYHCQNFSEKERSLACQDSHSSCHTWCSQDNFATGIPIRCDYTEEDKTFACRNYHGKDVPQ